MATPRPRPAEMRGTPLPTPGRWGMRDLTYDDLRQSYRATTILFFVAGFAATGMYAIARDAFEHPSVVLAVALSCLAVGATFAVVVLLWLDRALDLAPPLVHVALLFAGIGTSAALYGAGPDQFMIATVVYLQPLIFACYLLKTSVAFAHITLLGLEFGVALSMSAPIEHPVAQWAFLVGIGSSGALVLGRLADTASEMARSEYEARSLLAGRLRRFLSQPVADAIAADSSELLSPHRRPIAVFFCDLRGFTSFAANAEPEDVVEVLGEYYSTMGRFLDAHKATFGSFAGDGIMAYFGDPLPVDNPTRAALDMAIELATALDALVHRWHHVGYELNFGIGITYGHATLGVVGYEERSEYTALGSVVNLAARISDQAEGGQILLDGRAASQLGETDEVRPAGDRVLKGLSHPVAVFEAIR
jgi:class 3 adenylate cyclase